jgi:putative oxidoreductase
MDAGSALCLSAANQRKPQGTRNTLGADGGERDPANQETLGASKIEGESTMTHIANAPSGTRRPRRLRFWTDRTGPAGLPFVRARVPGGVLFAARLFAARAEALDHAVSQALRPLTLPALRVVLGLVFVWFGGLKIIGRSPVAALVAQTLPFANHHLALLVLGTAEVSLGLVLVCGVFVRLALPALALHLAGTFSTFVVAPHLMFNAGDPLLLTSNGEFVLKNVVLIAAALVLIAHTSRSETDDQPAAEAVPTFVASQG